MIADLGYEALILALVASTFSIILFIAGARRDSPRALQSARNAMYAAVAMIGLASLALLYALVSHDFSLKYVASYSSLSSPLPYTIAGFWAGNGGSLLFWALALGVSGLIMVFQLRRRNQGLIPWAAITVLVTEVLFLVLMVFVQNPFQRLAVAPADGTGLNPLLENPGMIFHPTTLLAGYAVVTIPFAIIIATLFARDTSDNWLGSVRQWTLVVWTLLGIGNVLGMQWAYVELGWGGFWAWDPVENAGLMPWLTLTAFLHSIMIQRRTGSLRTWNIALIGASYFLAIFGTFLTRSNILKSVHTFGDSGMEPYFLFFMVSGLILFAALVVSRISDLQGEARPEALLSRETGFTLNNVALVGATVVVLLGTMSPLFSRAFTGDTITVGPQFFNTIVGPLLVLIVLLMGICPLLSWYRTAPGKLWKNLIGPLYAALATGIVLVVLGTTGVTVLRPYAVVTFCICAFVVTSIAIEWVRGTAARHKSRGENYGKAFFSLLAAGRARYGGYIVHLGVVLTAIGIIGSSAFGVSREFTLSPGGSADVEDYTFTYSGLTQSVAADRTVVKASLSVARGGRFIGDMGPATTFKRDFPNPVTEIALRSGPAQDLYVILEGYDQTQAAALKVLINPLVFWIWIGGGLLLAGAVLSFWPTRKSLPGRKG
ncbi:MAG: heme lyase CcmF/NrfE family subunit [Chloroflexi bacterium]|nr:heme lyase CcmF/NrfE family subunit [Chloroflexota bacterium]